MVLSRDLARFGPFGEAEIWSHDSLPNLICKNLGIFHGLQMSTLHCIACGYESSKSEIFSVLSLPLVEEEGQVRLHHCLDRYTRGNFVKDWTCPSCCKTNDVYMRLDYWRLPPVIFHLKRFSFSGTTSQKIDTRVSFTLHDLDLLFSWRLVPILIRTVWFTTSLV